MGLFIALTVDQFKAKAHGYAYPYAYGQVVHGYAYAHAYGNAGANTHASGSAGFFIFFLGFFWVFRHS